MDKSLKALTCLSLFSLLLAAGVMVYNYTSDPMCYYHCDNIDLKRKTQNVYYQAVQTLGANPDAEIIVLGSSRGERVASRWIEERTGKKTINLSQGGADLLLKIALSNIALERNKKLKTVIWMADYFEFLEHTTDSKLRENPVLSKHIDAPKRASWLSSSLKTLQVLIDHNTFEAAMALPNATMYRPHGNGGELDPATCSSDDFSGEISKEELNARLGVLYPTFSGFLKFEQTAEYQNLFLKQLKKFSDKGIDVVINIAPYHPQFIARFHQEFSNSVHLQDEWIRRMVALQSNQVKVLNYASGIPGDNAGPQFWEDSVHPTCYATIKMLERAFQ